MVFMYKDHPSAPPPGQQPSFGCSCTENDKWRMRLEKCYPTNRFLSQTDVRSASYSLLFVGLHIYIYICIYTYVYIYIYVYTYIFIHMDAHSSMDVPSLSLASPAEIVSWEGAKSRYEARGGDPQSLLK